MTSQTLNQTNDQLTAPGNGISIRERMKRDLSHQWKSAKKHKVQYLFLAPYLIIFILFTVVPVVLSIGLGFTDFNVLEPPDFVGLQNYFRLFLDDKIFIKSLANTIMFAVVTGPIGYMIALLMAWLMNELPKSLRVIITVLLYAPSLTGGMTVIFKIFFSSDATGYLNAMLLKWGLINDPIKYLENPDYIVPIVIFVVLWGSLGTQFLSFIAGLQGVDRQYYDAGAIDGIRNRWQELWFITLPLIKPQLLFGAVISITGSFGIGSIITGLNGTISTDYSAHTLVLHLQDYGTTRFEMGYASAIATLLFLVMVGSNIVVHKLLEKVGE